MHSSGELRSAASDAIQVSSGVSFGGDREDEEADQSSTADGISAASQGGGVQGKLQLGWTQQQQEVGTSLVREDLISSYD